jgi:hypothetical protein
VSGLNLSLFHSPYVVEMADDYGVTGRTGRGRNKNMELTNDTMALEKAILLDELEKAISFDEMRKAVDRISKIAASTAVTARRCREKNPNPTEAEAAAFTTIINLTEVVEQLCGMARLLLSRQNREVRDEIHTLNQNNPMG